MSSKEEYGRGKMVDNGGIWDEQSFRDFEINRDKNAINQLETELAEARAEIERKDKLIEQMESVFRSMLEKPQCEVWRFESEINAVLDAAERGGE